MTTLYPDLFPETLLINREGDRIFTTSLKVAEHFGKRHANVLRATEKLLAEIESHGSILSRQIEFAGLNFESSSYLDRSGRTLPMYKLTEEGFALLAMGFTGKEALTWKVKFLTAFRDMERQLQARTTRYVAALDAVCPSLRPVVEGTEAGLSRAEIAAPLSKSAASVTYHRRRARRLGLLTPKEEAAA